MKKSDLFKVVPVAAIALSVYSTGALAGATNRDSNTAATPGPKSTTVTTPADAATGREDMRRGTTQTENMDTPTNAGEAGGSGSAGGTGSNDVDSNSYRSPNSSANPGAGSTPENADSGYDLSTGNTSGSSTGAKDASQ